jgi:Mn2+/Fe2+ NRAMP family transporter
VNRTADQRAYFAVNIILAGVILLIMGYSGFYSPDENEYPVVCIHEKLTGEQCPSCGLSHAFSLIVRGRIDEALLLNSASLRVFLFFALQLFMRLGLGARSLVTGRWLKQIAWADTLVSSAMALYAFYPFLRALWTGLFW